jgi:hypothetical protein
VRTRLRRWLSRAHHHRVGRLFLRDTFNRSTPNDILRQDRLQRGYISLAQALPWLHLKLGRVDIDDCEDMLKKVRALNNFAMFTHNIVA